MQSSRGRSTSRKCRNWLRQPSAMSSVEPRESQGRAVPRGCNAAYWCHGGGTAGTAVGPPGTGPITAARLNGYLRYGMVESWRAARWLGGPFYNMLAVDPDTRKETCAPGEQ